MRELGGRTLSRDAKLGGSELSWFHDNFYIVPQRDQESHQALDGIATELASQHGGHFRLSNTHELSHSGLGQMSLLDDSIDLNNQAGLNQMFARIGVAEALTSHASA